MFNAYIDRSGRLKETYQDPRQLDSYTFIICTRGECRIDVYTYEYTLTSNQLITLLPYKYFRVIDQQPDTELYVVSFDQRTFSSADVFETIVEHITHIIETPIVDFPATSIEIMCDYFRVLMRVKDQFVVSNNSEFVNSLLKQIIIIIGTRYKYVESNSTHTDRSKALVLKLVKLIAKHYKEERSAIFYTNKMHLSPQYLSSLIKQVTNSTITDIIAMFVIINAQTKLASTDLSIGEIASELNFDDISLFGRYFKRYTKLSPRQYRKTR